MSFLAPLFLAGAAAIALPILFHLIRKRPRGTVPFSALMFLNPSPPSIRRKSRIENWLLLLLRCLAVALLALGFSRPFFLQRVSALESAGSQTSIILLDISGSMRGEAWNRALDAAGNIVRSIKPNDDLAILTFDRSIRTILDIDRWRSLPADQKTAEAQRLLSEIQPGWDATRTGAALIAAGDLASAGAEAGQAPPATIHLVSDFQRTSDFDALIDNHWAANSAVVPVIIPHVASTNASIQLAGIAAKPDSRAAVTVAVTNPAGAGASEFRLRRSDQDSEIILTVQPGRRESVTLESSLSEPLEVSLQNSTLASGETVFVAPRTPSQTAVAYLGPDSPDDAKGLLFFLARALQSPFPFKVELTAGPDLAAFSAKTGLVVLAALPTAGQSAALESYLANGAAALLPLRSAADASAIFSLSGQNPVATESGGTNYSLLAAIDFRDPIFAPFADPRFSDFTKIHFWRHRVLDLASLPHSQVLARFDDDSPALLRIPVGRGNLLVLTSTWAPADSQLALSSKFVPLLYSILENAAGIREEKRQFAVGESVPLPVERPAAIRKPDGASVQIPSGAAAFTETDQPGIYRSEDAAFRFAVNTDPRESDVEPLTPGELAALQLPEHRSQTFDAAASQDSRQLNFMETESRQRLWWWLIIATLAVLIVETLVAAFSTRATPTIAEAAG
jgi:hypothetical protein